MREISSLAKADMAEKKSMKSMTGFGTSRAETLTHSLDASVKVVNGRFLEMKVSLPKEYFPFESAVRDLVKKKVLRGTVDLSVHRKRKPGVAMSQIHLDGDVAAQVLAEFGEIKKKLKLTSKIEFSDLLSIEGFVSKRQDLIDEVEEKLLIKLVQDGLTQVEHDRVREGQNLQKDILLLLARLKDLLIRMQEHRDEAQAKLHLKMQDRLRDRWQEMTASAADPDSESRRWMQEILILIDKSDIHEELNRFTEHLRALTLMVKESGALGKKLDFYTQELLREMNTIGSKSPMVELTQLVVEAKSEIEKLKEQIQNVE